MARENWDTEAGGSLADFDITITHPRFVPASREYIAAAVERGSEKAAGAVFLAWEGDSEELGRMSQNETFKPVTFSCGDKWEIVQGGKAVRHRENPEKKKFMNITSVGMLIERLKELQDEEGKPIIDILAERGDPTEAEVWTGLSFRVRRETIHRKGLGDTELSLPYEFLGVAGEKKAEEVSDELLKRFANFCDGKTERQILRQARGHEEFGKHDTLMTQLVEGKLLQGLVDTAELEWDDATKTYKR